MSKLRTGAIFTQEILQEVTKVVEGRQPSTDQAEAVFKRKIGALQKFLQHGMSRFSVETLQNVIFRLVEYSWNEEDPVVNIRSLREVRAVVKNVILQKETGRFGTNVVDALHYMELFFYCVYCLSEGKRLFGLVYHDLYGSYYDPNHMSRPSTRTPSSPSDDDDVDNMRNLNGHPKPKNYSRFGITTLDQLTGSRHHKLQHTVEDMKMVLDRWTQLLTEDIQHPGSFDPESEQDLVRLHDVSGMENVLRLVPDMFAKYYKCLELTKQWWVLAHEIYPDLPFQRSPSLTEDGDRDSGNLSGVMSVEPTLDDDSNDARCESKSEHNEVSKTLKVINNLHNEIDVLQKREEKFEVLMETYDKVGNDIGRLTSKRNQLLLDQEIVKVNGTTAEITKHEKEISVNESSIRLLEFQQALLFEDYVIHLELRPSIIRFLHDAKAQLNEAEQTLTAIETNHSLKEIEESEPSTSQIVVDSPDRLQVFSQSYQSEYSLQSIERGVQAVSDKCREFSNEKTGQKARRQSLNRMNNEQKRLRKNSDNAETSSKDNSQQGTSHGLSEKKIKRKQSDDKNATTLNRIDKTREALSNNDRNNKEKNSVPNKAVITSKNTSHYDHKKNVENKGKATRKADDNGTKSVLTNKTENLPKTDKSIRPVKTKSDHVTVDSTSRDRADSDASVKIKTKQCHDPKNPTRKDKPILSTTNNSKQSQIEKKVAGDAKEKSAKPEVSTGHTVSTLPLNQRRASDKNLVGNAQMYTKTLKETTNVPHPPIKPNPGQSDPKLRAMKLKVINKK